MAIRGIKITLGTLWSFIFPHKQYSMNMSWGIWYLALRASTAVSLLTKWANSKMEIREGRNERLEDLQRRGMFSGGRVFSGRRLRT